MIRRYPTDLEPLYDITFITMARNSFILNPANVSRRYGNFESYSARQLQQLKTDWEIELKVAENDLSDAMEGIYDAQQMAEDRGRIWTEPNTLAEKRLSLEAIVDIRKNELDVIEKCIQEAVEEEKEEERPCLPNGLAALVKYNNLQNSGHADGQELKLVDDRVLIVDARSPYRGMELRDYVLMAKQWLGECKTATRLRNRELEAKGIPMEKWPNSTIKLPLPKWPEGVKNHLNGKA